MVKRALCSCGGVIPKKGPGSKLGYCAECLRRRRRRQLVEANTSYRANHGYPSGIPVGASYITNPIGMVVLKTRGKLSGPPRPKHPRYL